MKRIIILIVLLFAVAGMTQEKWSGTQLETNAGTKAWLIESTGDDTSAIWNSHMYQSFQYYVAPLRAVNDTFNVKIEIYGSTSYEDSTFKKLLTVTTSDSGATAKWSTPIQLNLPPIPYNKLVVTGIGANDSTLMYFRVYGWTNQPGQRQ